MGMIDVLQTSVECFSEHDMQLFMLCANAGCIAPFSVYMKRDGAL